MRYKLPGWGAADVWPDRARSLRRPRPSCPAADRLTIGRKLGKLCLVMTARQAGVVLMTPSLPSASAPSPRKARPFPLVALCFLLVVRSLLYAALAAVAVFGLADGLEDSLTQAVDISAIVLYGVVAAVLFLIAAVGLWQLRPWAWRLTMILSGVVLLLAIWQQFGGRPSVVNAVGMVLNILIVFYLVGEDVRALFVTPSHE
jgi:uncharacterized membrane protein (DUF2068 family)